MSAPEPMTPADCDLRDFPFMPLDVVRLRDSDLSAKVTGDEFRAAVLLWCAAWHQVPAGSLPDDDAVLAQLSGYGRVVSAWREVRAGALSGWVLCSDGRLYHPVVAEKAIEAWGSKMEQRWRTECARIRKHNQRHGTEVASPSLSEFIAGGCKNVPLDTPAMSHGTNRDCHTGQRDVSQPRPMGNALQGTGTGTGTDSSTKTPLVGDEPARGAVDDDFDERAELRRAHADRGKPKRDPRAAEVGERVRMLGNFGSIPSDFALVGEWLAAGADPERHIYPVVKATAERLARKGDRPKSLKLFDPDIRAAITAVDPDLERYARIKAEYGPNPSILPAKTTETVQ